VKTLYFITSNKGKYNEAKEAFSNINIEIIRENLGYSEIQANSLEEVVIFGVKQIQERFSYPFIIEDAGLFINALNGFPGVYSSYIFQTLGCIGILKLLKSLNKNQRQACFKSVYGYCLSDKKTKFFTGECNGIISDKKIGENGFGYDPIFIPNNSNKTFAQMNTIEKNNYSHRGKSLAKLIDFIINQK
jgi:XTP/dITP diphosphohydrolase